MLTTARRSHHAIALVVVLLIGSLVFAYQSGTTARRTDNSITTFSWQAAPPATGVHVVTLGLPHRLQTSVASAWLPVSDGGEVSVPMLAIAPGCGIAEEFLWLNTGMRRGPQHVRWVWLGCW